MSCTMSEIDQKPFLLYSQLTYDNMEMEMQQKDADLKELEEFTRLENSFRNESIMLKHRLVSELLTGIFTLSLSLL